MGRNTRRTRHRSLPFGGRIFSPIPRQDARPFFRKAFLTLGRSKILGATVFRTGPLLRNKRAPRAHEIRAREQEMATPHGCARAIVMYEGDRLAFGLVGKAARAMPMRCSATRAIYLPTACT